MESATSGTEESATNGSNSAEEHELHGRLLLRTVGLRLGDPSFGDRETVMTHRL